MTILITNDDGIDAAGIETLARVAAEFGKCIVVAPDRQHSGVSHKVSDAGPISVETRAPGRYALGGTPADCTRVGVTNIAPDAEWVLSGVNEGGNLGCDVFLSGTVAAAREATLCGRKAVAFSQYRKTADWSWDWPRCAAWTQQVFRRLRDEPLAPGEFWNVNFPHLPTHADEPEIVFCQVDTTPFEMRFEEVDGSYIFSGRYHERPRTPGRDIDVCFSGGIAVSRLTVCSNAAGTVIRPALQSEKT